MAGDIFNPSYPGTYFGLEAAPDSTASDTVSLSTTWWAGMIRPTVSKTVTTLQWLHWGHAGSFVVMTVGLYSDSSGAPGTLLQVGTVTPTADNTWESISITSQAVTAGTPYWVVIHGTTLGAGNTIDCRRINDPDGLVSGASNRFSAATSTNSGVSWTNKGTSWMGCIGFGYNDSTFEGCGYGDFDTVNINNTNMRWGEYFQVPDNISVNSIAFKVFKNAAGTPTADLTYVLMNADSVTTLATGTIVTAGTVTQTATWYTASFSTQNLVAGTNYRVYMSSAATASPQYTFRPIKTVNNGNANAMTFGGTTDVEANNNSGTFQTDATRDTPFRLGITTSTLSASTLLLMGVG